MNTTVGYRTKLNNMSLYYMDTIDDIEHVFEMQCGLPGLLSGLFLTPELLSLLDGLITHEDHVLGSVGRYQRVPIYQLTDFNKYTSKPHGSYKSIYFTYIPMHSVD